MFDNEQNIKFYDLGLRSYEDTLNIQHHYHQLAQDENKQTILFVEHTPVVTKGHFAEDSDFITSPEILQQNNVDIFKVERGGKLTAHMPGQIVVYPILNLASFGLSTRSYVTLLEKTLMDVLREYGIESFVNPEYPGVWVGNAKVAAIGVRIKNRASMHGLALNVNNKLDLFKAIVPCGILGKTVTTMAELSQRPISIDEVKLSLLKQLVTKLSLQQPSWSISGDRIPGLLQRYNP